MRLGLAGSLTTCDLCGRVLVSRLVGGRVATEWREKGGEPECYADWHRHMEDLERWEWESDRESGGSCPA